MKLHERLRELRSERGLRLKDVAEIAGISVPDLSDLERGRTNPSLETLQTLAGAYAITVHDLLEGVEFYGASTEGALPKGSPTSSPTLPWDRRSRPTGSAPCPASNCVASAPATSRTGTRSTCTSNAS